MDCFWQEMLPVLVTKVCPGLQMFLESRSFWLNASSLFFFSGMNVDISHAVVKRIGFAQTPLVCLMFRLVREAAKYAQRNPYWQNYVGGEMYFRHRWFGYALCLGGWLVLVGIKLALGSLLQRASMAKLEAAPEVVPIKKQKKA